MTQSTDTETKFLVRMPTTLHAQLKLTADGEHISMNDLAVQALTDRVERRDRGRALLARGKAKHAATLAALADR